MAFHVHEMTALLVVDPKAARRRILDAYRKARANARDAAKILGCGERTLHRWVDRLMMKPDLERMARRAQREGWYHDKFTLGGRPAKEA